MRVLIAAGGTGGHVIPAIRVARELERRGAEILFAGTTRGIEIKGFRTTPFDLGGLNRVGASQALATLLQLPAALVKSARLLEEFRPDVVYGVGAYVSGPVLLMAAMKGIPVVVHEANAVPGITNRLLAPWITRAVVVHEETLRNFPVHRAEVGGLPVAEEFFRIPPKAHVAPYTVLVTGGSQGSAHLNRVVVEALPQAKDLIFVHQTGVKDLEMVKAAYEKCRAKGEVTAFISDMSAAMARADLVVSRAGAATLAELAAAGKASLLVPFPFASDDHQLHNALSREAAGAARVLRDSELDAATLLREIAAMLPHLAEMEASVRRFAAPEAITHIAEVLEHVC